MFCGDFVGDETGDGGTKGFTVGDKDICLQCLGELKYRLSQVEAKTPVERVKKTAESEEDSDEVNIDEAVDEEMEAHDPFSAKPKE